jgi:hypothetical protein
MPHLIRAVLKFIYDEQNMSVAEIDMMKRSVVNWFNAIKIEDEKLAMIQAGEVKLFGRGLTTDHKYEEEKVLLDSIGKLLRDNETGKLNRRKRLFKEKGIDYRKFHRLPECYTEEGLYKAKEEKAKYDKKHPEQEGIVDAN